MENVEAVMNDQSAPLKQEQLEPYVLCISHRSMDAHSQVSPFIVVYLILGQVSLVLLPNTIH